MTPEHAHHVLVGYAFRRCADCGLTFEWSMICPACQALVPQLTQHDYDDLELLHSHDDCSPDHLAIFWHFQDHPTDPIPGGPE